MRHWISVAISMSLMLAVCLAVQGQQRLPGFGKKDGRPQVKGFGSQAELWSQVIEADINTAKSWMMKYDQDKSGVLEPKETASWGASSVATYDLNRDGDMYEHELALAIALARIQKNREALAKARRKQREAKKAQKDAKKEEAPAAPVLVDPLLVARQNMCNKLAGELIGQHDRNGNGQLELAEWQSSGARFGRFSGGADTNADDLITAEELAGWLLRRLAPSASERLAKPLRSRDANGDGQITLSEYANPPSEESSIEFRLLDQNNDGLISPEESYAPPVPLGAVGFASNEARVIQPKQEVRSTVWIDQDMDIADLDIRVAITKPDDDQLKLFLVGPDEQRIVLYAGAWKPWSGSIFESTLIDDEARQIDTPSPQPPYPRRLRTDALKTEEPGLSHFYSKSARGQWQLVVVNMNDNVGVLHRWSLWVRPE